MWKYAPGVMGTSEYLLRTSVLSMMEMNEDIFAAGNCYDARQYKNYNLFCPFAFRLPEGAILGTILYNFFGVIDTKEKYTRVTKHDCE